MKSIYMILTHSLARTGLRLCLSSDPRLRVLGDAGDAKAGWPEAARLNPDILLVDEASLKALNASGVLPVDSNKHPNLRIALFTGPSGMDQVDVALRIGVRGFIDAATTPEAFVPAILRITDGERFVSPSLLPHLNDTTQQTRHGTIIPEERLSARELEVFALTAEGLEAKEIGDRLGISPRTVDVHRASMRQKLGLTGVHELIRFAVTWSRDRMRTRREDRFCNQSQPMLLIEDDEVDVLSIERALNQIRVQFPVENKRNGEEALDWLRSPSANRPFLILLDVNMPRMNGHEFLAELRKDPSLRGIPVIVFTTSTLESDRTRMYDAGIAGFMVKPTRTDEFAEMFRALAEFWGLNSPPPPPRGMTPASPSPAQSADEDDASAPVATSFSRASRVGATR
jgi:DNA-binding NarL/FixJ family response regulator